MHTKVLMVNKVKYDYVKEFMVKLFFFSLFTLSCFVFASGVLIFFEDYREKVLLSMSSAMKACVHKYAGNRLLSFSPSDEVAYRGACNCF